MRLFGTHIERGTLRQVNVRRVARHSLVSLWRIYLMLVLAALLGQRWLIYPASREVVTPVSSRLELLKIAGAHGRPIHAYYLPASGSTRMLVMFHGNGEQLANTVWLAEEFARRGLSVLAVEYPGYGLSKASSSTEQAIYEDAEQAIRHVQVNRGIHRESTVILGQSLGAAVAAEMALRGLGARLILISPFTSMVDMARQIAPILPTDWLVEDRFDTFRKAPHLALPTLLVHGTADTVVPTAMGLRLAKQLPSATLKLIAGANHNDVYDFGGEELIRQIADFADARN